ncbi:hypothetical protein [Geobacillus stearothermophilus]|uniref:hypothetical protein n=1 Tax=Geobacillus stearothermophilus TaxID=1422 RepID=UPI003D25E8C9
MMNHFRLSRSERSIPPFPNAGLGTVSCAEAKQRPRSDSLQRKEVGCMTVAGLRRQRHKRNGAALLERPVSRWRNRPAFGLNA